MKKQICTLAMATAIAFATLTAKAEEFGYTYTGTGTNSSVVATGILTGNAIGDYYDITSGDINVTYDGGGTSMLGNLDTNSADLGRFNADNLLFPLSDSPNGLLLDVGGLLFKLSDNELVNMWGGDNNGNLQAGLSNYSITSQNANDVMYPGHSTSRRLRSHHR